MKYDRQISTRAYQASKEQQVQRHKEKNEHGTAAEIKKIEEMVGASSNVSDAVYNFPYLKGIGNHQCVVGNVF